MKNKVLYYRYSDRSSFGIVRIYTPEHFEQAERDHDLLREHASDSKDWFLEEVEVYNPRDIQVSNCNKTMPMPKFKNI